jgi:hypothetical protein
MALSGKVDMTWICLCIVSAANSEISQTGSLPWSVWTDARTPLRFLAIVAFLLFSLARGNFVELHQAQKANAEADRNLIPLDLAIAKRIA